jgi:hypothetical protein
MNKTFKELGYKAGDTVRCVNSNKEYPSHDIGDTFELTPDIWGQLESPKNYYGTLGDWELVCDPSDLTWGDMTPEQQGALLLAHHQGKTVELKCHLAGGFWRTLIDRPMWSGEKTYRIKPEPVVVHQHRYAGLYEGDLGVLSKGQYTDSAYVFTYDTEDGVPVCSSVKLSKLT